MLSHLVPSFSKLTASTIVGNMTATSKTFGYLGCFPNCRCFRFKTNRWSTNMCCSGYLCPGALHTYNVITPPILQIRF